MYARNAGCYDANYYGWTIDNRSSELLICRITQKKTEIIPCRSLVIFRRQKRKRIKRSERPACAPQPRFSLTYSSFASNRGSEQTAMSPVPLVRPGAQGIENTQATLWALRCHNPRLALQWERGQIPVTEDRRSLQYDLVCSVPVQTVHNIRSHHRDHLVHDSRDEPGHDRVSATMVPHIPQAALQAADPQLLRIARN